MDLVVERVEPSPGVGLGRPVERPLQLSDLVLPVGGTSHDGTHRSFPVRDAQTKQRPFPRRGFCCPVGSSGTTAASDALPAPAHFPVLPVIRRDAPTEQLRSRRAGEGLPSSRRHLASVPSPICREVPRGCNPGSPPLPWPSP